MDGPMAVAWVGFDKTDATMECEFKLNWANSLEELTGGLKKCDGFAGSFVFATVCFIALIKQADGDIGYWATGKIPIREKIIDALYIRNGSIPSV